MSAFLFSVIVGGGVAAFALANTMPVTLRFLFFNLENIPLGLTIILAFLLGIALTVLVGIWEHFRLRWQLRQYRVKLEHYEAEASEEAFTPNQEVEAKEET